MDALAPARSGRARRPHGSGAPPAESPLQRSWVIRARRTTRSAGRTFALASRLLSAGIRDEVCLLYYVLRTLDDLVDDGDPDADRRVGAVADWAHGRAGAQTQEVEMLRALDARHHLPRETLLDFCHGMYLDLGASEFETEADLDDYCYCVAGTVGLMMSTVLGVRDWATAGPAATSLGIAMQRTNILRDIDEDSARGRVFISRESRRRYGSLAPGPGRAELLRDQIIRADALYDEGLAGVGLLVQGRRAITVAGCLYRETLRQIERDGLGLSPGRAVVSRPRRLAVGASALIRL